MSHRTTPTGRHRRGCEGRKAHKRRIKDIDKGVAIYEKEEVGGDDEYEGSMDKGNNVRYWRMNWIDITTECQVQLRIIYYWGSPAEIIGNPKELH
jgi:hypothetical protein